MNTDAACTHHDPDLFFPTNRDAEAQARTICHDCPIQAACLEYALTRQERYGIWGGTTPSERARLHRRQQRPTAARLRRDATRDLAQRLYAQGRGRTDIARFLHLSGSRVNRYLNQPTSQRQPAA